MSEIAMAKINEVSVCCFGNPLHSDDGVGLYIYEKLKQKLPKLGVHFFADAPLNALDVFESSKKVILIDAIKSELDPGSVLNIKPENLVNQTDLRPATSHLNSLPYLLEVSRHMLRVPPDIEIWGITTQELSVYSEKISKLVSDGANLLVEDMVDRFGKSHCHA